MYTHNKQATIGVMLLDPDAVQPDYTYVVQLPKGSRLLRVTMEEHGDVFLWAVITDAAEEEKKMLHVLPGGRPITESACGMAYLGAFIVQGDPIQDWHVFVDHSVSTIDAEPQSKYRH